MFTSHFLQQLIYIIQKRLLTESVCFLTQSRILSMFDGLLEIKLKQQLQKIMNNSPEEKYSRNQRYKKQEYYRHPLDQQQDYNSRLRQQQQRYQHPSSDDNKQFYQSRQSYPQKNYETEGLLPPIRTQNKQNVKLQAKQRSLQGQEDKTQIYLKNCEYIIKNLRGLKQKKQKDHYLTVSTEPTPKDQNQNEFPSKQDFQYYPKVQQFSSQGRPYNKMYPVQAIPKYKQNLRKLDDCVYSKSYEQQIPIIRIQSLPKKVIKNTIINKYEIQPRQERSYYRSQRGVGDQSNIPYGFDERGRESRPYRRFSSSKSSQRNNPIKKYTQNRQRQGYKDSIVQKQKNEKQVQNMKVQKELISCLSQLTQFLKNQNKNTNKQPNLQTEKQIVKQNSHETLPRNTTDSNFLPQQPQKNNIVSNCKQDQNDHNQKAEKLKEKAIVALKKLNERSKSFVQVATNHLKVNKSKQQPSQVKKKRPSVTFIDNTDYRTPKQKQIQIKANPEKADQQKALKPIISIPANFKAEQNQSANTLTEAPRNQNIGQVIKSQDEKIDQIKKQIKRDNLNSELAKQLGSFLQKQENQNIELSFCLKELTQFLKIQNDEIVQMKSSRYQQEKANRKKVSPPKHASQPHEIPEIEQEQEEMQKSKTSKLQQAVLKKLKKARLRGNIFKQKVQSFRKSHNLLITKRQPRQKQVQKDVEIKPVTSEPADGVNQQKKDEQSSPMKQLQATNS